MKLKTLKINIFQMKYKIIFTLAIKFKRWYLVENNKKSIGKSTLIYQLASKYNLPIYTNWEDLYKGYNVITPTDCLPRIMSFENKVILVDIMTYQTSLEIMYILSRKNNILIGFTSEVDFNRKD